MRTPFPYLGNGFADCAETWCVVRGPLAMRFTQDGDVRTSARGTVLTLARFPYFATFASSGGWGVGATPPRVSKLSVVELSGKTHGLVSMSTRDWWCVLWS